MQEWLAHSGAAEPAGALSRLITDPPMVGRELELAQVRSALLSDAGAGMLLAGASGVGKTRLAEEAAAEVAAAGLRVVRVSPTWAGRHLRLATLRGRAAPQGAGVHGTALHGSGLHGSGLHGSGVHGSGVHEDAGGLDLRRLLGAEVRGRGVLVLVDDVHLLDAGTAELLLELARLRRARLLLMLNTEHQPPRQITAMWKDQHLTRMELRPLDAFVMRRLAGAMLGGNLQYASAVRLTKLAHGNPLLLRELVYAAIDQGVLSKTAGRWVLAETVPLSPRLRELLGAKVGQLSAPARRALELIVLAEPAPLAVLEALAGADGLAELEAAELVRVPPEAPRPQVRLSHPLIGEVVRQQLPALRRRELMRGWVLACRPPASTGSAEWLQHVAWQLDAGLAVEEQTLLAAARLAYLARDLTGASRFAEAAWHTYGTVAAAAQCAGAMVGLGRAESAYAVLDAAAATHGDHPQLAVARTRGYLLQARLDEAQTLIAGVPGPDGALCGAMVAYFRGHFEDCSRQCEPLLADPDPARRTEAVIFAMAALCHQGRAADALQLAATLQREPPACDRFVLHDDSFEELVAAAHADLGNLAEASRILGRSFEHAMSAGLPRLDAQKGLALGFVLLERGRPLDALRLFDLGPLFQVGWQLWHVRAQVNTLLAACVLQDQAAADRAAQRLPPVTGTHFTCYHLVALAWQASLRSDWDAARKHLVLAADTAASHGGYGDVAIAVHELARLGLAEASRPYWGVPVQGPLQRARLDYARALATGDRQLLSATASAFEVMGAHLYSAEAFAELARLYRRLGQRPLATEAARRAHGLKARCQGAETPALCLIDEVEPLSRREREIAVLAARGLDDRTIAERLTLSVRTVGNHLHRAYQKLGISSRRELRMALAPDRLGA